MATASSTFTELVSTTFRKHRKEIKDNISTRNALYKYIVGKGNYQTEDGGLEIVTPLDYAENSTYQRYSDWDTLNIQASDVISAAKYDWKQIAINVVSSGRELRINSGEAKIIKLATAKIKNAKRTFANTFSEDMYSDGTASNQINGLQKLISDDGTGAVGGITAATGDTGWWMNNFFDCSDSSVTSSATTIENSMLLPAWLEVDRGPGDQPDLIVMDNTYYQYFETSQVSIKRYSSSSSANAGFQTLKYKGADVLYDGNSGIPSSTAYLINTEYLGLCVHKDADLDTMEEQRPINQDGVVVPIIWMGNMTCSNRAQQSVIVE